MDPEFIRKICEQLAAVTEEVKWDNDLVFSVGGKMFSVCTLLVPHTVSFKVPDEDFEEYCDKTGFQPAPYLARAKWVQVSADAGLSLRDLERLIITSYQLVVAKLPKKKQQELKISS